MKRRKDPSWQKLTSLPDVKLMSELNVSRFLLFLQTLIFIIFIADVWNRTPSGSSLLELSHHIKSSEECELTVLCKICHFLNYVGQDYAGKTKHEYWRDWQLNDSLIARCNNSTLIWVSETL